MKIPWRLPASTVSFVRNSVPVLHTFCEVPRERFVVLERLQLVAVGQTVLGEIHEAIVVLTQHPDVYIVIPRNESAVTRRPEKRSRVHKP